MSSDSSDTSDSKGKKTAGKQTGLVIALVAAFVILALAVVIGREVIGSDGASQEAAGTVMAEAPTQAVASPTPSPLPQPLSLAVVHTNDTWGYLYPCG